MEHPQAQFELPIPQVGQTKKNVSVHETIHRSWKARIQSLHQEKQKEEERNKPEY